MAPRRLLVISYPSPPAPSIGHVRWQSLSSHLRSMGHEVSFITTGAFGSLPDDPANGIVRTADLASSRPVRALLRRPRLPQPGERPPDDKPPSTLITKVVVPDAYLVSWVPWAVAAARRFVRSSAVDCVVTSTPYDSTHFVGWATRGLGPAWLADFRDPWVFEPVREPFPLSVQRRLDAALEAAVVRRADRVVANELPVLEDFRRRHGVHGGYVPNGWDPALAPARPGPWTPLDAEKITLVHTGGLSGVWGRDPGPFFAALERACDEDRIVRERLRVLLVGRLRPHEAELIERYRLAGIVRHAGHVSRNKAIALQRRANVLVLITSHRTAEAPGKLFEYLGSNRPILVLGEGNEAARIVTDTARGVAVPPHDVPGIAAQLCRLARGELQEDWEPGPLGVYRYPAPAEAMIEQVELAIAARHRR